ncbi:MAG TPA: ATP-binding protein [Chloroflexota bacterium]
MATTELTLIETLRPLYLFAAFDDEQLAWVAAAGEVVTVEAGAPIITEGAPADAFYVLLDGTIRLSKRVGRGEADAGTSSQPGAWLGYFPVVGNNAHVLSARAVTDARLLRLPASALDHMLSHGFPIAPHLMSGIFLGKENLQALVRQQEKMSALGRLSAGLAHELNNPAAAARRGAAQLREAVEQQQAASVAFAAAAPEYRSRLGRLQRELADEQAAAAPLAPLARSDRADALAAWLEARGVADAWDTAPALVDAGLDIPWLEGCAGKLPPDAVGAAIAWVATTVSVNQLIDVVERSSARISELVHAVKEYAYMDQAPKQEIDVHDGLENTLIMLGYKLKHGVTVVRDYDRSIPRFCAYGGELNQVWTNLIDNAVDAMGGRGTLRVRTARDDGRVLVEIGDSGAGISPELQSKIFEPFFTTKDVGSGTGLGLEVVWRIVVNRHHGDVRVESVPGDTRFQVRLPLVLPQPTPA